MATMVASQVQVKSNNDNLQESKNNTSASQTNGSETKPAKPAKPSTKTTTTTLPTTKELNELKKLMNLFSLRLKSTTAAIMKEEGITTLNKPQDSIPKRVYCSKIPDDKHDLILIYQDIKKMKEKLYYFDYIVQELINET